MELEPVTDSIAQRSLQQIALLLTVVVFAIGLAFCFFASSLCVTVTLAALLAILIDPLVVTMEKAGLGRTFAAGVSVLFLVLLLGLLTYALYQKANAVADDLPIYSYRIQNALRPFADKMQRLQRSAETLKPPETTQQIPEVKVTETPNWPSFLFRGVGSVAGFIGVAGVAPFLAFFMLIRKKQMYIRFQNIFEGRIDTARFVGGLKGMVRAYVLGNLVVGSILSGATAAVFLVLGLKSPLALGIVCGFVNLVPFLGVILAAAISLAAALLQFDSVALLIGTVVAVAILHLIAVNLLIPRAVGPRLQIGPVAITVGLLFWSWLWGVIGLILAVPLTALMKLIADSHPRFVHFSNLLAHEPKPIPRWMMAGQRAAQRVRPYFKRRGSKAPDRGR